MRTFLLIAVVSYLLGSIPFGYLLVRIFRGEDVRQSGSGNIGATNVARKSPLLGVITLLLDALKGALSALLSYFLWMRASGFIDVLPFVPMAIAAFFAVAGHMFPVWLRFRGGKGVATALGSFAILAPKAVLIAAGVFIVALIIFRYVSLGSIIAAASFPFVVYVTRECPPRLALSFIAATSLLVITRHHANIRRLLAGTENRLGAKRA